MALDTITTAGMLNVLWNGESGNSGTTVGGNKTAKSKNNSKDPKIYNNKKYVRGASKQKQYQSPLWEVTKLLFGFSKHTAIHVHKYLSNHMLGIASDNLAGQCTKDHSCKNSTQMLLQTIVDHYNNTR